VTEPELLNDQGRMTDAVDAGIATIIFRVMFEGGTGTVVGSGDLHRRCLVTGSCHVILHGMSTLVHAVDRNGKHNCQENQRNKFEVD
jgi:hypothetical protein